MHQHYDNEKLYYFYSELEDESVFRIFAFMLISLGCYIITWIYKINIILKHVDEDAPDPLRGVFVMFFFPVVWYFIVLILKFLIFKSLPAISGALIWIGWALIIFLSLKYFYDFSKSFGKVTQSNPFFWYFSLYLGYYSLVFIFLNFWILAPFLLFPICTIPAMQATLNWKGKAILERESRFRFNRKVMY